jgi:hypothetical protein
VLVEVGVTVGVGVIVGMLVEVGVTVGVGVGVGVSVGGGRFLKNGYPVFLFDSIDHFVVKSNPVNDSCCCI